MLFLFGYGSLVWKHPFPHEWARVGVLRGWRREFCQASTDHRGTTDAPGRVVTLVRDARACTTGLVFAVAEEDREKVLAQLDFRERGGYERVAVDIAMADDDGGGGESVRALLYVGTETNANWVGEEEEELRARIIASAVGPSGSNREYFDRLMAWLETRAAGGVDPHLRGLQARVARVAILILALLAVVAAQATPPPPQMFPPHERALRAMAATWNADDALTSPDHTPCSWPGITCSPRGHVLALDWHERNLEGPLGTDIWSIVHLVDIDLRGNRLAGRIDAAIGNMQNLIVLDLSNNRLDGHMPDEVENLPMMEILRLDNNALRSLPVPMPALRELAMRNNRIAAADNALLLFPNLKRLYLAGNELADVPEGIWDRVAHVEL